MGALSIVLLETASGAFSRIRQVAMLQSSGFLLVQPEMQHTT
jgi:hypothetical protein